jgi:hypothetical protein
VYWVFIIQYIYSKSYLRISFPVDKHLLTFSLRERNWVWDIDQICAQNIAPNVLDILSAKMAHLSQNAQVSGDLQ